HLGEARLPGLERLAQLDPAPAGVGGERDAEREQHPPGPRRAGAAADEVDLEPEHSVGGEGEVAVAEGARAPAAVHLLRVEAVLRADDDARARLGEPEEGALALEDLRQHDAPALVAAAAADGEPGAAADEHEREPPALLHHHPGRAAVDGAADAVVGGDEE